VSSSYLTDDELLLAVATFTKSFSALTERQFDLHPGIGASDPDTRKKLMLILQAINNSAGN
jgi:hypothetical protein